MNRRALLRVTVLVTVMSLGSSGALAKPALEPQPSSTTWLQQQLAQVNWQGGPPPRWGGGR